MNDVARAERSAITDLAAYMGGVGESARAAARVLARADTAAKNRALDATAAAVNHASSDAHGRAAIAGADWRPG